MGGLLTLPAFVEVFPAICTNAECVQGLTQSQINDRSTIQGISVASYNLGCFAGAIACIFIGDMLGRRKTIFVGSAIMVVGAALQCSAFSLPHFIIGRVITGIGNGLNTSTVPSWQSECSKAHRRGQFVMIEGALITGGICISYVCIFLPTSTSCANMDLVDRFWNELRPWTGRMAVPHRIPDLLRPYHSCLRPTATRLSKMVDPQGKRGRGLECTQCFGRQGSRRPSDSTRVCCHQRYSVVARRCRLQGSLHYG